jgi:hypothetical protein
MANSESKAATVPATSATVSPSATPKATGEATPAKVPATATSATVSPSATPKATGEATPAKVPDTANTESRAANVPVTPATPKAIRAPTPAKPPATLTEAHPPYAAALARAAEISAKVAEAESKINRLEERSPSLLSQATAWLQGQPVNASKARASAEDQAVAQDHLDMVREAGRLHAEQTSALKAEATKVFLASRAPELDQLLRDLLAAMDNIQSTLARRNALLAEVRTAAEHPNSLVPIRLAEYNPEPNVMLRLSYVANSLREALSTSKSR